MGNNDPLTGDPMTVVPPIRVIDSLCRDAIGREVTLDQRGNWVYVKRYRLRSLRASSEKYGSCEVCREHVSEVFHQVEERLRDSCDETQGWTRADCRDWFGHRDCLKSVQR